MMKNDYRRALIMLRAVQSGLNGHVRLERRTLMGSMQFSLCGVRTGETMQAAMAAKTAAGWKIVHIGTLGANGRGQAGLNWTFDPRSIEGLPLEKYSVLLVLATGGGACRTAMTGYVNGSVQVDWQRVEQAACAAYAAAQPEREETFTAKDAAQGPVDLPAEQSISASAAVLRDEFDTPAAQDVPASASSHSGFDAPAAEEGVPASATVLREAFDTPAAEEGAPASATVLRDEFDTPAAADVPASAGSHSGLDTPAAEEGAPASATALRDEFDSPAAEGGTALQALGLDPDAPWPEDVAPLRSAFASSPPVFLPAMPGYVFIRAFHSAACPECAVGIRAENGRPVGAAWAIPGGKSDKPAQGLEGYEWKEGWWISQTDAGSGSVRVIAPSCPQKDTML